MQRFTINDVFDWIKYKATGPFYYKKVLDVQFQDEDYPKLREYCRRAVLEGIAARVDGRDGWFRPLDKSYEEILIVNGEVNESPLVLPLEMHEYAYIFEPALILVSGEWNKGKSAYCLECAYLNADKYETILYISEGAELMKLRIKNKYGFIPSPMPFKIRRKLRNFADIIEPGKLIIIDYLRPDMEKSFAVANELASIQEKLTSGIAIVAMQKHIGTDVAYGGEPTQWEPTLSIAIGNGYAKFTKIKVPKIFEPDPYKLKLKFQIVKGVNFTNVIKEYG